MPIPSYTSYPEVRSALGVSSTELPDTVLSQSQWSTILDVELEDVAEGLPALYASVSAISSASRTAQQTRFYDLTRLFSSLSLAKNLLATLPMFSVSRLADGRAEFERAPDIHADTREAISGLYSSIKARLAKAYSVLEPAGLVYSKTSTTLVLGVPLASDPITTS